MGVQLPKSPTSYSNGSIPPPAAQRRGGLHSQPGNGAIPAAFHGVQTLGRNLSRRGRLPAAYGGDRPWLVVVGLRFLGRRLGSRVCRWYVMLSRSPDQDRSSRLTSGSIIHRCPLGGHRYLPGEHARSGRSRFQHRRPARHVAGHERDCHRLEFRHQLFAFPR